MKTLSLCKVSVLLMLQVVIYQANSQVWQKHSKLQRDSFGDPWYENESRIRVHGLNCCCAGCVTTRNDLLEKEQRESDERMKQLTELMDLDSKEISRRRDLEENERRESENNVNHVAGCGNSYDKRVSYQTTLTSQYPLSTEFKYFQGGDSRGNLVFEWMPRDTAEKGTRFTRNDFLGRDNRWRSSRYEGGYLSAEFREDFIRSRMDGLNPGDAGYDQARRKAEGAWSLAVKQYDRRFQQYGQELLREQSRHDFQKRQLERIK